jgi:hypothetical protein
MANIQTPSPNLSIGSSYLPARAGSTYGFPTRASSRFHSLRAHSPAISIASTAYSPYPPSHFSASPAMLGHTPLASPPQPDFNDADHFVYFENSPAMSHSFDGAHSYGSPTIFQHPQNNFAGHQFGNSSLVSPPITPMDSEASFSNRMVHTPNIKSEGQYPMTPYTPTYPEHLKLPDTEIDMSRRPVSAGRLIPQGDMYGLSMSSFALKRTASLNSNRYAKSVSPPRSVGSSPPGSKRPTYSKWTPEEDEMLRTAISIHGTSKWSLVASMVKGRTAMQCSTRWQGALNTTIHKGKWEAEEDRILVAAVEKWKEEHPPHSSSQYDSDDDDEQAEGIPWGLIATMLPRRRTGIQCQARWSEALDPSVRKGKWTVEEDEMLFKGVAEFGQCWIKVASKVRGRTQRQIRTRWMQLRGRDKMPRI